MKAIFLDRDGVINKLVYYPDWQEHESPRTPEDFDLLPGVLDAIQTLQKAGWTLFLISNQPSYAKGKTSLESLHAVQDHLHGLFDQAGITFKDYFYSYTHPNGVVPEYTKESEFRKPNPGFLLQAEADYGVNLAQSWMVGDRDSDMECGKRAGCRTAQIMYDLSAPKRGQAKPNLTCADLLDFVRQLGEMTS